MNDLSEAARGVFAFLAWFLKGKVDKRARKCMACGWIPSQIGVRPSVEVPKMGGAVWGKAFLRLPKRTNQSPGGI